MKGLGQDDLVGAWGHAGEVGGGGVEGGAQAELLEDPGQAQALAGLDLEARELEGDPLVTKVRVSAGAAGDEDSELPLQPYLDRAAERRIRSALARCEGRRAAAARSLGVERTTLYRLMKKFGIAGIAGMDGQ